MQALCYDRDGRPVSRQRWQQLGRRPGYSRIGYADGVRHGRQAGKLPTSPDDRPPGDDPGLVKVSVPEARRLLRLATAPMSRAARDLGYAWSRWRRRHQARARWHHYHARLRIAEVT